MDRPIFYDKIRVSLFNGTLSDLQVEIIDAILNECVAKDVTDIRQIAYAMATTYHECYSWNMGYKGRMIQLKEMGSLSYLKSKKYYPYFGRGASHLTWKANYKMESNRLGIDLINNPDLLLDVKIAAESHVYCMKHGSYTGKKLSDFIDNIHCDFFGARRIINGTDQAALIATYASKFLDGLMQ